MTNLLQKLGRLATLGLAGLVGCSSLQTTKTNHDSIVQPAVEYNFSCNDNSSSKTTNVEKEVNTSEKPKFETHGFLAFKSQYVGSDTFQIGEGPVVQGIIEETYNIDDSNKLGAFVWTNYDLRGANGLVETDLGFNYTYSGNILTFNPDDNETLTVSPQFWYFPTETLGSLRDHEWLFQTTYTNSGILHKTLNFKTLIPEGKQRDSFGYCASLDVSKTFPLDDFDNAAYLRPHITLTYMFGENGFFGEKSKSLLDPSSVTIGITTGFKRPKNPGQSLESYIDAHILGDSKEGFISSGLIFSF
jgi:hypothetical protein